MNALIDDFSDLDDFDTAQVRPLSAKAAAQRAAAPMIACPRCAGRGHVAFGYTQVRQGACFTCNGTGKVRADWEKRRTAFKKGEATKAINLAKRAEAWKLEHVAVWLWIRAAADRGFEFADSLRSSVDTYGHLTERQLAAAESCMAKDLARNEVRAAEAKAREVVVPDVRGENGVVTALNKATRTGHKAPKLRTASVVFSLAKASSANAGCVYVVTPDDLYLGKITPDGVFKPSRDCTPALTAAVAAVAADPLTAAIEYGKATGRCSCCGRELTDPVSIAKGIGPICESGFF